MNESYAKRNSLVKAVLQLKMSAYVRAPEAAVIFFPELRLLACRETCMCPFVKISQDK